ncbi:MAG TPA: cyclic nucleotide-binding domain-containing protein [Azospirillaceae bacterium]|nr:cyclic nucleotide-binding domain-containing protein [Azospirillaceae bacterium]
MAEGMTVRTFQPGTRILDAGQPGTEAYVVRSGLVEAFRETPQGRIALGRFQPGAIFGEMALIDGGLRMASAEALEPTECLVVTRAAFLAAFHKAAPLVQYMLQTLANTIRGQVGAEHDIANARPQSVMPGAAIVSRQGVGELLSRQVFAEGRAIVREGEPGTAAYLIQSGLVELRRQGPDGAMVPLRRMGPGCVFGEMALVERRLRSATAVAIEQTVCEVVKEPAFQQMVRAAPPVIGLLLRAYIHHVHQLEGTVQPLDT